VKTLKTLDPTWWRRTPRGYEQQEGRAKLLRSKAGWELYIEGARRGEWTSLRAAKLEAGLLKPRCQGVSGYSNFGGGGPFASMGSKKETP
jgi:hypothetical protein